MHKINQLSLDRRAFLGAMLASAALPVFAGAQAQKKFTGAIIGHSGRGDYGHAVDLIFTDREDVQLLAVADPVAEGRAKAAERSKAPRQYQDYKEMLEKERPQLVGIAPRWTDQRREMALAAIAAGAH